MMRLLSRLTVMLTVLFAVMIGLIRTRPYDSRDLRAFFAPENCNRPCWQNIQPGVTTIDEALTLLRADRWVSRVERSANQIHWSWSGQQPALVDSSVPGIMLIERQRVVAVSVQLNAGFGDLQLAFGQPRFTGAGKFSESVRIHFTYPAEHLTFVMQLVCPMGPASFWHSRPEVALNQQAVGGMHYDNHLRFLKWC